MPRKIYNLKLGKKYAKIEQNLLFGYRVQFLKTTKV